MSDFLSKNEMKKHKIRELEKRFLNFDLSNSDNDGILESSWCNCKITEPNNQKLYIHISNLFANTVYPEGYKIMSISPDKESAVHLANSLVLPKPIYVTKVLLPNNKEICKGDLLFKYKELPKTIFSKMFNSQSCYISYNTYRELDYFVNWFRNDFKCGDNIPMGKLFAAHRRYREERKTVKFMPYDFLNVYEKTDTYLYV